MQLHEVLKNILEIIDYQNDHDEYIQKMIQACGSKVFMQMLATKPADFQESIKKQIEEIGEDQQRIMQLFEQCFDKAKARQIWEAASDDLLHDYVQAILPTLSEERQGALQSFLESINRLVYLKAKPQATIDGAGSTSPLASGVQATNTVPQQPVQTPVSPL